MRTIIPTFFCFISLSKAVLEFRAPKNDTAIVDEFADGEASFGADISDNMASAYVVNVDPPLACGPLEPQPAAAPIYALVDRGNCTFTDKALFVQKANYSGMIVVNVESDYVFSMGASGDFGIRIPAIMVGVTAGHIIREKHLANTGHVATIRPNTKSNIEYYLVPFLIALSLAFMAVIVFLAFRVIRTCLRQSKSRLSRDVLKKLPEIRYSEDYQSLYETCAICLEDYAMNDKLRVLPCHHAFHSKCVDRWLLRRQSCCPICKYRIRRRDEAEAEPEVGGADEEDGGVDGDEGIVGGSSSRVDATGANESMVVDPTDVTRLNMESDDVHNTFDDEDAPLLTQSAGLSTSWRSGGQLPVAENTWLGYDNPAATINDEFDDDDDDSNDEDGHAVTADDLAQKFVDDTPVRIEVVPPSAPDTEQSTLPPEGSSPDPKV